MMKKFARKFVLCRTGAVPPERMVANAANQVHRSVNTKFEVARISVKSIPVRIHSPFPISTLPSHLPAPKQTAEVNMVHVMVKMWDVPCCAVVGVSTAVTVVAVVGTTAAIFRGVLVG